MVYLSLAFLVVYIGAVAVLFLFIVMMINFEYENKYFNIINYKNIFFYEFIFVFFFFSNVSSLLLVNNSDVSHNDLVDIKNFILLNDNFYLFYKIISYDYWHIFFVVTIILFVSMIGSIVLVKQNIDINKINRQNVFVQHSRDIFESVKILLIR